MIATADGAEVDEGAIWSLLESMQSPRATFCIVLRDGSDQMAEELLQRDNVLAVLRTGPVSLASARNTAISWAMSHEFDDTLVLGFPDDDCWYPVGVIDRILRILGEPPHSFVLGCFGPSTSQVDRQSFPQQPMRLCSTPLRAPTSSVGLFVRFSAAVAVGGFNECLGVGTPLGSHEDHDFITRLLRHGFLGTYDPDLVIFHEYAEPNYDRYSGWLAVCTSYALFSMDHWRQFVRAWGGLAWRLMTRQIPLSVAVRQVRPVISPRKLNSIRRRAARTGFPLGGVPLVWAEGLKSEPVPAVFSRERPESRGTGPLSEIQELGTARDPSGEYSDPRA